MVSQERIDTNSSEEEFELRQFAQWIIRGNPENLSRQWLRRGKRRHIEVDGGWFTPKGGEVLGDNARSKKKELSFFYKNILRGLQF